MSDYVLDTSALIQAVLLEENSLRVRSLLQATYEDPPTKLHLPVFGLTECVNVLWKQVRFNNLPLEDAKIGVVSLTAVPLYLYQSGELFETALEIGVAHQLAIYDSLYIALAKQFSWPLISDDAKQIRVAQAVGVTIKPLTDFPDYQG